VGVEGVVLGLATVDGLPVQRVTQDEGDLLAGTQVSQPVPAEQALAADDEVVALGGDGIEKGLRRTGQRDGADDLSGLVEDVQRQGPGMEIDAAVESVRLVVETHGHGSLVWVGA
jgi:hypothetical protein